MRKVFITRAIPAVGIELLQKSGLQLEINSKERNLFREELLKEGSDAEGVISLLSDSFDREAIDSFPKLKIIANYAVGYNNIDIDYCKQKGIYVSNTPGVLTETTADLAFALLMSVARRIVEADAFTRAGKFKGWEPELLLGYDIYGKNLGIIGLGRIGTAIARRAEGFSMQIGYHSRTRKKELETERKYCYMELEELLEWADFIIIACPLTEKTRYLLDYEKLSLMKKTAFLINIARGQIIREKDLVKILREGKIAGAGLDVYEKEPEIEKELIKMKNVVLLPHIGSASYATRNKMAEIAAQNIISVLMEGREPITKIV
jgi:glyoxylate reductase